MFNGNARYTTILGLALVLSTTSARAQQADRFEDLQTVLKTRQTIVVTDDSGHKVTGRVLDLTSAGLVIETGNRAGVLTFSPTSVREIRKRDRWWDGALIGLAIGCIPAASAAADAAEPAGIVLGLGLFAGIGFAIDAAVPAKLLYRAARK